MSTIAGELRPFGEESGGGDEDSGSFARAGPWPDHDFDVAVEGVEEMHEAFDRKALEAVDLTSRSSRATSRLRPRAPLQRLALRAESGDLTSLGSVPSPEMALPHSC